MLVANGLTPGSRCLCKQVPIKNSCFRLGTTQTAHRWNRFCLPVVVLRGSHGFPAVGAPQQVGLRFHLTLAYHLSGRCLTTVSDYRSRTSESLTSETDIWTMLRLTEEFRCDDPDAGAACIPNSSRGREDELQLRYGPCLRCCIHLSIRTTPLSGLRCL